MRRPATHHRGGRSAAAAPWDTVQLARNIERPNTLEYIGLIFDDFVELHGDRLFKENAAIVGGPAVSATCR